MMTGPQDGERGGLSSLALKIETFLNLKRRPTSFCPSCLQRSSTESVGPRVHLCHPHSFQNIRARNWGRRGQHIYGNVRAQALQFADDLGEAMVKH